MSVFKKIMNQYYTEKLAEHGYVKVKGRYPYWAKMVGDEIVLIITYASEMANGTKPLEAFSLWGTVATVYRPKIDFEHSPKSQRSYMVDSLHLYQYKMGEKYRPEEGVKRYIFECNGDNEESVKKIAERSYQVCEEEIITRLDKIKSLPDVKEFYEKYISVMLLMYDIKDMEYYYKNSYCEALLLPIMYSVGEYESMMWKSYEKYREGCTNEKLKKMRIDKELDEYLEEKKKKIIYVINIFKNVKNNLNKIMRENKENNYIILKEKGIIK